MKKFLILMLIMLFCLVSVSYIMAGQTKETPDTDTSAVAMSVSEFNESPMLAALVAEGKLPPVEERLPDEPLVIAPNNEIGKYGGTIRLTTMQKPANYAVVTYWMLENPINRTQDASTLFGNVLKGYEESPDFKTFTFFLREGLKWSDGEPVTMEDVKFWYEDIFLNSDLMPSKPSHMKRGDTLMKFEFVDDLTFRIVFPESFPGFMPIFFSAAYGFGGWGWPNGQPFVPKHYLSEFHIAHNDKANDLAKEAGFDYWYQLMGNKNSGDEVGRPGLHPWIMKDLTTDVALWERNPYYFKVDPAGNQLPYVDYLESRYMADPQSYMMSVIGGETDYALPYLTAENYPLLKENESKGDYTVNLWKKWSCGAVTYFFYQTYEDDLVRELLQNVKFRQAMSVAINRDEMNELLYYGRGDPGQCTVPPGSKYHIPEMWNYYAQYDPELANQLLDEIGLKWDSNREYRVLSDGKTLQLKIEGFSNPETPTIGSAKLVKEYWEAVGVKVDFDFSDTGRFINRFNSNQVSVTTHWVEMLPDLIFKGAPWHAHGWWTQWINDYNQNGRDVAIANGADPAAIDFFDLVEEFNTAMSEDEKLRIGHEINRLWTTNLWGIGTIGGDVPAPQVAKNYIKNNLESGLSTWFMTFEAQAMPFQFYIDE